MEQLWPDVTEDSADLVAELTERTRWVAMNFVHALDGAIAVEGVSGPLGGDGDRLLFRALRDRSDVVLAGAGTVRAEQYGPTRLRSAAVRTQRGQQPRPVLAIVTRSGDLLDLDRLWSDPDAPIVVVTGTSVASGVVTALEDRGAEVLVAGDGPGPDLVTAVEHFRARGLGRILCEGGPALAHDMLAAGLVTDLFTTVGAVAVGGGATMLPDQLPAPVSLALAAVRRAGDEVMLHHRVTGEDA